MSGQQAAAKGRRQARRTQSWSRRVPRSRVLWDLDWGAHLPIDIDDDVCLDVAELDEVFGFVGAHYASIFDAGDGDERFVAEPMNAAKRVFYEEADCFAFRHRHDGMVGLLVGHPFDWSTYYWRTVAFVPEMQGRGLLSSALAHTDGVMGAAGVQRVEGEASPTNYRQVRLLHRLGYCVTGSHNSERFGSMLRLTKFLSEEAEETFERQFCRTRRTPRARPRSEVPTLPNHQPRRMQ